jgi:transcriptional regulator with XRE-family HTH domain
MKRKIKNYKWHGFGFLVIFNELPAVKLNGELVPDLDLGLYATPIIEYICADQNLPLSGNQVKFIRHYFNMSLREFAVFLNVKHQSIMRWEQKKNLAARIDRNTEFVVRLLVLKKIKSSSKSIDSLISKVEEISNADSIKKYKQLEPIYLKVA